MALSFTRNSVTVDNTATVSVITSGSLTFATNDVIVAAFAADDNTIIGALTISNSGTALTWTNIATTNTGSNTKVAAWWARAPDSTSRTVTITDGTGNAQSTRRLHCLVHTGAHATTPVPAGKIFSGTSGHNAAQAITPTATGSMLWMMAGDWAATNTFAAATNCTLEDTFHDVSQMSAALIRPTTQPRTDALAFTIGETDTGGTIAWLAFEVQAAASAAVDQPYTPWPQLGPLLAQ